MFPIHQGWVGLEALTGFALVDSSLTNLFLPIPYLGTFSEID